MCAIRHRRKAKIWKLSTPTTFNGPISVAMRDEAQVVFDYYVQCPECGQFQKMIFKRIKWTGGMDFLFCKFIRISCCILTGAKK